MSEAATETAVAEFLRKRWIPKDSTAVERPDLGAVVYLYGTCCAMGYRGKAFKPSWHFTFRTDDQRQLHIRNWFDSLVSSAAYVAERKAKRASFTPSLKVGDILSGSWGYDQTNAELWQVTDVRGKHVIIRELCTEHVPGSGGSGISPDSEHLLPCPGKFTDKEPLRRLVQEGNSVKLMSWGVYLTPWDGRPVYNSWGH